jgi:hypothetical protein
LLYRSLEVGIMRYHKSGSVRWALPLAVTVWTLGVVPGVTAPSGSVTEKIEPAVTIPVVHMGREADPEGRIPERARTDVFMLSDDIFVAPYPGLAAGMVATVEIVDPATGDRLWRDEVNPSLSGDRRFFARVNKGTLDPGNYILRMDVGSRVIEHPFGVSDARREGSLTE